MDSLLPADGVGAVPGGGILVELHRPSPRPRRARRRIRGESAARKPRRYRQHAGRQECGREVSRSLRRFWQRKHLGLLTRHRYRTAGGCRRLGAASTPSAIGSSRSRVDARPAGRTAPDSAAPLLTAVASAGLPGSVRPGVGDAVPARCRLRRAGTGRCGRCVSPQGDLGRRHRRWCPAQTAEPRMNQGRPDRP